MIWLVCAYTTMNVCKRKMHKYIRLILSFDVHELQDCDEVTISSSFCMESQDNFISETVAGLETIETICSQTHP